MKMGEKVKRLRQANNYRAASDLAAAMGRPPGAIELIESGQTQTPRIDTCQAIAQHFLVSLDWLVDESQGWPQPPSAEDQILALIRQTFTNAGMLGDLTQDEYELLRLHRSLGASERDGALLLLKGFAAGVIAPYKELPPTADEAEIGRRTEVEVETGQPAAPYRASAEAAAAAADLEAAAQSSKRDARGQARRPPGRA